MRERITIGVIGILALLLLCGPRLACAAAPEPPSQAQPPSAGQAIEPHEQLKEILERPLYTRWKLREERAKSEPIELTLPDSLNRTLDEWCAALLRFWDGLWNGVKPSTRHTSDAGATLEVLKTAGWIALGVVAVFLGVLLYRALRQMRFRGAEARILSRERVAQALADGEALAFQSPEWLDEADRLAAAYEFRAVYRALYLALLSGLHAANKIDFRKTRTNWTYVRGYRGPEPEKAAFTSLTSLFDRVWYGEQPATQTSIPELRQRVAWLLAKEVAGG